MLLSMQKKCLHYQHLGLGLRRHVQRCVFAVQPVPSGQRRHSSARRRITRSAVRTLTLSATDRFTAAMLTVDTNSCYESTTWTLSVASRETMYRLLVTKLPSAVTDMFASHALTSLRRVHRPSHQVRVRPRRSQTVVSPTLPQRHRHRRMTTSTRCFCRLVEDERLGTRRCHRRYSRCHCRVESCRRRRSRTRDRHRRQPELDVSTARNCSSCRRITPGCVRMRRTTAQHASSM